MLRSGAGLLGAGRNRPNAHGVARRASVLGLAIGVILLSSTSAALAAAPAAYTQVGAPTATGQNPYAVAFSPDGGLLADINQGGDSVSIFSVTAGGALTPVGSPTGTANPSGVAFSPDGGLVAVANGGADTVSIFSVTAGGALIPVGTPTNTGNGTDSVVFSPNGGLLATSSANGGSVSIFSVTAGGALSPVGSPTSAGTDPFSVAFSPNGGLLATANEGDSTVSVFSVSASGQLTQIGSPTNTGDSPDSVAFSPDGQLLATSNLGDGTVSVFSVSAGGALTPAGSPTSTGNSAFSVAFSPSGQLLAVADVGDGTVSLFSVGTGGLLTPAGASISTGSDPTSAVFSPNGALLATSNAGDNTLSMFAGGEPSAQIRSPADQPTYGQNQTVATRFGCTDPTGAPGIIACTDSRNASSPSGTLDTSTLGAHAYTVTATSADTLTTSTTLHYTVIAAPAANPPTPAPSPAPVDGCPTATGQLTGNTLGLITLGMTRAQATRQYAESSSNGKPNWQFFCLTPRIIRAGYPSPQLLTTLSRTERTKVTGRVVIALTASRYYDLKGVRSGTRLRTAARKLHTGAVFTVGKNDWYMAPYGTTTAIIKVRHGTVEEIGTADRSLTRTRTAQRTFITSFS